MLDLLLRWNRWGSAKLAPGHRRDVVAAIRPFLDTREIVGLIGPRRAGKSTVLYQLMDVLGQAGVPPEQMLHVNLEEPGFAAELGTDLLDRLFRTFREEVSPHGRVYLFFDEIQVVPGWERWVRARNEAEDVKVFVTGSSAKLLSRELGTVLTGRHVSFRVRPLGFAEFLRFRDQSPPKQKRVVDSAPMQKALRDYLQWGGFPEVVLATDVRRKELLLKQYFDDVIYRDVALRHEVRDLPTLRALAVHLLGQTSRLVSFQRLGSLLGISDDLARIYCSHLQEAMLIDLLPFFSTKLGVRTRNPQKVFAVDTGLRNAVCSTVTPDLGSLVETAAHGSLERTAHDGLFWWRGEQEVDLLVRQGERIARVVQVSYELREAATAERECGGLLEGSKMFPQAQAELVVQRWPVRAGLARDVTVRPLWRFLLDNDA